MKEDTYPSRNTGRPRVLRRLDPVVHGRRTGEAPLAEEQIRAYERDGFLVLNGVFDGAEIGALRAEARRLMASRGEGLQEGTTITEPDSGDVRSVFAIHAQSDVFARLAADARLAQVARFLLNDEIYIHQSRLNYKPGFRGKEFYWHSDFETWHVEDGMPRMRALSMSVLLTENTPHNGPLMLIPGSHMHFIACVGETPEEHYKQSLKKQEYGVPDDQLLAEMANDGGIAVPAGRPGSVLMFDCNVMHGSNSNITPFPRSNAFFVFNACSNALAAPFGPKRPRPEFVAARAAAQPISPRQGRLARRAA